MEAWGKANQVIYEQYLRGDARKGFDETMLWFDKGLAAGSPFV